jgi:23S rRNA U2552 (ribose-2'-O)-methylase RlmE/FtsJ
MILSSGKRSAEALKSLDFNVIEPATFKEVLKYLNFHTFNVIVVDENFDTGTDGVNYVLNYLNIYLCLSAGKFLLS